MGDDEYIVAGKLNLRGAWTPSNTSSVFLPTRPQSSMVGAD